MDNYQQPSGYDADHPARNDKREGDAPIYAFAVIATIVLVAGLFAWLRTDPPSTVIVPQTAESADPANP